MSRKKTSPSAPVAAPPAPPAPQPVKAPRPHPIDGWLERKQSWIIAALLALLFVIHSWRAASIYLNPDEALHYQLAHQTSARDAYFANNTNAHPPLLIMTLYYWSSIARGEWFLRLVPVACSIALVAFAYLWGREIGGARIGIPLAFLVGFMPPVFTIAIELRHYPLAMCFACGALYFFERALSHKSRRSMALSALFLWLAILSNYSVLWFTAGFGIYSLWRVWRASTARPLAAVWAGGQVIAAAMCAVLYVTHISKLGGTDMTKEATHGWLAPYYCGQDSVWCITRNTAGLCAYLFGHPAIAYFGGALLLLGLGALWFQKRDLLLLIGFHFGVCWLAVAAGMYPYGGTRHSILFGLPVALVLSYALSILAGERLRFAAAGAAAIVVLWLVFARQEMQAHKLPNHGVEFARQSVAYLKQNVPSGGLVFADHQAMLLLCYYANRDGYCKDDSNRHFWLYQADGFRIVASKKWSLEPDDFVEELRVLKKEFQLERGAEVWMFDGGWGIPLNRALTYRFAGTVLPGVRQFGTNLTVFRIPN